MSINNKKYARLLAIILSLVMITGMLMQTVSADDGTVPGNHAVINGRILTPSMTGDTSNWVEIAQYGDYSLIVRMDYIKRYANYENATWDQAYYSYSATTDYMDSIIRERINNWFNVRIPYFTSSYSDTQYEQVSLATNARLRNFTVQHNAMSMKGTTNTATMLTDGLSKPTSFQVGVGDDIAFALSSSEAARFVSTSNTVLGGSTADRTSHPDAAANFAKINIPLVSGYSSGMWLRSLGSVQGTVGGLSRSGAVTNLTAVPQNNQQYIFIYPALWVSNGIFTTQPGQTAVPAAQYATVVDGRVLTPDMTGDICNWVEIAQNGGYSLIVRADYLNIQSFHYGEPLWQSARWQTPRDGTANVGYTRDNVSHDINCWFNFLEVKPSEDGINTFYDVLPANARLREYTVQHNALHTLGTRYTSTTLYDGLSTPTGYQVGIGDNIAFCLSFSEAANYLCLTRNFPGATEVTTIPPPEAISNFNKIHIPKSNEGYYFAMWLRTPGSHEKTECALLDYGYTHELDVLNTPAGNLPDNHAFGYGLIYPAVWVGEGIFGTRDTATVTGQVFPMAVNNWGFGNSFLELHDVVVELRPTFLTPAAPALSTKAELISYSGYGEFTFEDVPFGDYVLYIHRPGYLTRAMLVTLDQSSPAVVTLTPPGTSEGGVFRLWWGDSNDDLTIESKDYMMILELEEQNVIYPDPRYNAACDLNADGHVDTADILMLFTYWNKNIYDYPGAQDVDVFS